MRAGELWNQDLNLHVTHSCRFTIEERLWGHPFNWETRLKKRIIDSNKKQTNKQSKQITRYRRSTKRINEQQKLREEWSSNWTIRNWTIDRQVNRLIDWLIDWFIDWLIHLLDYLAACDLSFEFIFFNHLSSSRVNIFFQTTSQSKVGNFADFVLTY